jgi:large subunit ribosomal protein L33
MVNAKCGIKTRRTHSEFDTSEATDMREIILLACGECKRKNYSTMKNKRNTPDKLNLEKYCRFCRKHTVHKETKA